jgi:putative membrane protein
MRTLFFIFIFWVFWLSACTNNVSKPEDFMSQAAEGGMAESRLAFIALQRASDTEVKAFAQMMVEDHTKANTELAQLAGRKGTKLPTDLNAKHKGLESKLPTLSGEAFDKEYMRAMVEDHEKDVKEFEAQSKDGTDADVKAFAAKHLPVLQQHLQTARDIYAKFGGAGK